MHARSNKSEKSNDADDWGEHDLIGSLKEVISSLETLCKQKLQMIYLDSSASKIMFLNRNILFVLFRKLLTSISAVACRGAMIKLSVFNGESEVVILVEYGARGHYDRKGPKAKDKKDPIQTFNPFTSSPGLDLLQIESLAGQMSWNLWIGGPVKNRGTRIFLSCSV